MAEERKHIQVGDFVATKYLQGKIEGVAEEVEGDKVKFTTTKGKGPVVHNKATLAIDPDRSESEHVKQMSEETKQEVREDYQEEISGRYKGK